ncbi:hypothetical protein DERP_003810 [Dermatophagoides pteronyssinus]|uniref:Uncharacterized protein n=1 Tax=Dermatophagoides pteronyssinus TaxID=6956 RepID=A0ABQ8JLN6_DERPT|nr:hypothetical protein DERP_003810 [Dermatophagoides pteronyssinus]
MSCPLNHQHRNILRCRWCWRRGGGHYCSRSLYFLGLYMDVPHNNNNHNHNNHHNHHQVFSFSSFFRKEIQKGNIVHNNNDDDDDNNISKYL